jgi:hypothetical protein
MTFHTHTAKRERDAKPRDDLQQWKQCNNQQEEEEEETLKLKQVW